MKIQFTCCCLVICLWLPDVLSAQPLTTTSKSSAPRIVNIVNFIRLLEPRDSAITEDVLYQTVVKQVEILKQYRLKGTFLLQYDALMDSRYQNLLRSLSKDEFEIGAWWEIPQPLVVNAGMQWRGRYPWDWRANIGFSTGYTQEERVKLIDTYMADFKKIFGYYPKSVSSWFIDAYSLNYMYQKYHIVASGNCKDQYGTDGYTLWGGYWNQAYYPSKKNSYMPAQNAANQIPVPVFRMLGSDPVRQYDNGLGSERQGVVTLEPVYAFGGGDLTWVHWFFQQLIEGESLAFAYTQAGQENSFTWKGMEKGFNIQMPLIAKLRDEHKIVVETLEESGKWFRDHYPLTPPTSVTVNKDLDASDKKTVWYNSRFYRVNLLWENGSLRIRDMHLFNENFPSVYEKEPVTDNECRFFTLPFVDGYIWSKGDTLAGLRFNATVDGKEILLKGESVQVGKNAHGNLQIIWQLQSAPGKFIIDCNERSFTISLESSAKSDWHLDLTTADGIQLPFTNIRSNNIQCRFEGFDYNIAADAGSFTKPGNGVLRITPINNKIVLKLDEGR
ncbi:MAG TPA: hypothetical protein VFW07_09590 [Parafilimonas sp.]|nr:hypothetical protein [Parafilimonas sp.]